MNESRRSSLLLKILLVVALITVLGAVGFYGFEANAHLRPGSPRNAPLGFDDCVWWALVTVTTIGYGDIYPVTLGGRVIAVMLMFGGIGALGVSTAAIAAYFVKNDQLQLLRLRRMHNHVVICGLGTRGFLLAKAFRERGEEVVVIEQDENNDLARACRDGGIFVLPGDAKDSEALRLARVPDAKTLICVCDDDGTNAQIAARARDILSGHRSTVLNCCTHIVDAQLWHLLRKWEMARAGAFRLQFFNVFDLGARVMLHLHPPFNADALKNGGCAPHLLVIGAGNVGQRLIIHAVRTWREEVEKDIEQKTAESEGKEPNRRLRITVIDRDATRRCQLLQLQQPEMETVCELEALPMDISSPDFMRAAFLFDDKHHCAVTLIYICIDGDALGLSAALALHHQLSREDVPIIVRMTEDAGLASLLNVSGDDKYRLRNLHGVALMQHSCRPDLVLGGTNEILAHAIHDKYILDHQAVGETHAANPFMAAWDQLSEEARESYRAQADHIRERLTAIGCDIAPLTDWEAAAFEFTPQETELMAQMEHARWLRERQANGWKCGPRDLRHKTNPNLVAWEKLPDEARAFNRSSARELPEFLARAGFQIYRFKTS